MTPSPQARSLLDAMARDHGLSGLDFDERGLIPIRLDPELDLGIACNPATDSLYAMAVIDPEGLPVHVDPEWAFRRNRRLAARRTRLAIEPATGVLTLVRDIPLAGVEYWQFAAMLDAFVADARAAREECGAAPLAADAATDMLEDMSRHILIRI